MAVTLGTVVAELAVLASKRDAAYPALAVFVVVAARPILLFR